MRFFSNDAVEILLTRLLMSIAVIAAIILLVVFASGSLKIFLAEQQVEQQCRLVISSLSTMVEDGGCRDVDELNAAEGAKRIQSFTLPESLVYLCFGGDPDTSNTGVVTSELFEDGAVIFYKVQGGGKKVIWLPKETYKFREGVFIGNRWVISGSGQSFIIRRGGSITLVFERIEKNHIKYLLIHQNDEIEE